VNDLKRTARGNPVDEMLANLRRLNVAHVGFAVISAFALWIKPGTFTARWPSPMGRYLTFTIAIDTAPAWLPYLISWLTSRRLLARRSSSATIAFIVVGTMIAFFSCGLYLHLGARIALSPLFVSASVTLALLILSYGCAAYWRSEV